MRIANIDADIKTTELLLSPVGNPTNNEYLYNLAAYHTQQAIEKSLKFLLHNVYGMDEFDRRYRIHNISELLVTLTAFDTSFPIEHIDLFKEAVSFSVWESTARYSDGGMVKREAIKKGLLIAKTLKEEITEKYQKYIDEEETENIANKEETENITNDENDAIGR